MGVMVYNQVSGDFTLGAVNLGLFLFVWAMFEIIYQVKMRDSSENLDDLETMEVDDFN